MSETNQYRSDAFAAIHETMDALQQIGATDTTQFWRLGCGQDKWREQREETGLKDRAISASVEQQGDSLPSPIWQLHCSVDYRP